MIFFCSNKDKVPEDLRSNVIYELSCPGCNTKYVGKTDRCFHTRKVEHAFDENSTARKHLNTCTGFQYIVELHDLPSIFNNSDNVIVSTILHIQSAVYNNIRIINRNKHWVELFFLEALHIKRRNPELNVGVKATKDLVLFK